MWGLTLTYIATVVGIVGAFKDPAIGLYIYVTFAVLRPQFIFSFAGDMSNLSLALGVATIAGWAVHGFGTRRFGEARWVVIALLLFTAWIFAASAQATVNSTVAYAWSIEFLKIVVPFLVGVTVINSQAQSRMLLWAMVLAQGYVGFEMNYSYLVRGFNYANEVGFGGMDNNSFGISLVTSIGPAIALTMIETGWRRWLTAGATALILHTVLLTFSRGAFLGLLAIGVATFAIMPKRPKYVLGILLLALVALRFAGPQLMARWATTFVDSRDRDLSADSRLDLWADCFDVAVTHPLFGVGPRNWPFVAPQYGWPNGKEAHSVWMQTLAETGFPGVGLLVIFFGLATVKLWPLARAKITDENRYEVGVATGVILSITGFFVAGQFVTLTGLEVPYYTTMVGVALLKSHKTGYAITVEKKEGVSPHLGNRAHGPAFIPDVAFPRRAPMQRATGPAHRT